MLLIIYYCPPSSFCKFICCPSLFRLLHEQLYYCKFNMEPCWIRSKYPVNAVDFYLHISTVYFGVTLETKSGTFETHTNASTKKAFGCLTLMPQNEQWKCVLGSEQILTARLRLRYAHNTSNTPLRSHPSCFHRSLNLQVGICTYCYSEIHFQSYHYCEGSYMIYPSTIS